MDDKRRADLRERQLAMCDRMWLQAARKALAGDTRDLRNRVEMAEATPVQVVLSDGGTPDGR